VVVVGAGVAAESWPELGAADALGDGVEVIAPETVEPPPDEVVVCPAAVVTAVEEVGPR
jgi:hypothetical protein